MFPTHAWLRQSWTGSPLSVSIPETGATVLPAAHGQASLAPQAHPETVTLTGSPARLRAQACSADGGGRSLRAPSLVSQSMTFCCRVDRSLATSSGVPSA